MIGSTACRMTWANSESLHPAGKGKVARRPASPVVRRSGERPPRGLVQADGEDAGIIVEGILHAVAMMRVDVQIDDVVQPEVQPCQQPQHRVVQEAETGGTVSPPMMRAAARTVDDPALGRQAGRQHDAARRDCRTAINLPVDRVALRADPEARPDIVADGLGGFGLPQGLKIGRVVKARQLRLRRHRRVVVDVERKPAECGAQVGADRDARHSQGMFRPIA